jgi:hypothetical protein
LRGDDAVREEGLCHNLIIRELIRISS